MVDVSQFDTVEDLDVYFKKQKARANGDEAELAVDAARLEARSQFFEVRANRAALEVARRDAFDKYPLSKEFPEMINGKSPEEIMATAKTVHERLESKLKTQEKAEQERKDKEEADRQAALAAYGQPAGGGGSNSNQNNLTPGQAATERVRKRLLEGKGLQDSGGKMDAVLMARHRIRDSLDYIRESGGSYRNPPDRVVSDDRTARKNAR